jgi:hypothetical protein
MAIVHKVIVLNKPFKLFGFTIFQGIALIFSALIGLWVSTSMPPIKINGIPLGIWMFILITSAAIVPIYALQIKPWPWWRNRVLYVARLLPTEIFPKPQTANTYIDDIAKDKSKLSNSDPKDTKW